MITLLGTHQHRTLLAGAALVCTGALAASAALPASGAAESAPTSRSGHGHGHHHGRATLDLGPADLPETRQTSTLQPGVTLTQITRGVPDASLFWTVEVLIPAGETSPDPDAPPAALSDQATANELAADLEARGFDARVEQVLQPRTVDVPAGVLGYRVRVGSFADKAAADAEKARLAAAGWTASSTVFTGWDGDPSDRGPWHVNVLTIDPRRFEGTFTGSYGPNLHDRETTSQLAQADGAKAAVNAGFFVLDPAAGAPGDPAGAGVYGGKVLSESVGDRPTLVLRENAHHTTIARLTWAGFAVVDGHRSRLDGVDRVPGLIRNCGGDATDQPTAQPLHDVTCKDDAELVAFTPEFAASTPAGPGREVVLEHGTVVAVNDSRGTALAPGQKSLQATGDAVDALAGVSVGDRLGIRLGLRAGHRLLGTPSDMTVVNGGPMLVRDGRVHITQRRDGIVRPGEPSFVYGWFVKRNPRTFAGIDGRGRTVLVTVDGRSTADLGLSIPETADVARSLGLVDALNLDGGGSTTMVVDGQVISHPSDSTGERPVGDALLIGP